MCDGAHEHNLSAMVLCVLAFILSILFAVGVAAPGWGQQRSVYVDLRTSEAANAPVAESIQLYSSSFALIIGIDKYTGGWPRLTNAVKDAELVARLLCPVSASERQIESYC